MIQAIVLVFSLVLAHAANPPYYVASGGESSARREKRLLQKKHGQASSHGFLASSASSFTFPEMNTFLCNMELEYGAQPPSDTEEDIDSRSKRCRRLFIETRDPEAPDGTCVYTAPSHTVFSILSQVLTRDSSQAEVELEELKGNFISADWNAEVRLRSAAFILPVALTVLMAAVQQDDLEMVRLLLLKCPAINVNSPVTSGLFPLGLAAARGAWQIYDALLAAGARPHVLRGQDGSLSHDTTTLITPHDPSRLTWTLPPNSVNEQEAIGQFMLLQITLYSQLRVPRPRPLDTIQHRSLCDNLSSLHHTVLNQSVSFRLIVDVLRQTPHVLSEFLAACCERGVLRRLVAEDCMESLVFVLAVFRAAALEGSVHMHDALISAAMEAINRGQCSMMSLLFNDGWVNPNARIGSVEKSFLELAIDKNDSELIEFLVKNVRVDIYAVTFYGRNALHYAEENMKLAALAALRKILLMMTANYGL